MNKEGELIMGIGNGGGNLFVKGDYDSIKTLQYKLLELEELRKENKDLQDKIEYLQNRLDVEKMHPKTLT
jgi:predicted nuclease with TOPRIM domain